MSDITPEPTPDNDDTPNYPPTAEPKKSRPQRFGAAMVRHPWRSALVALVSMGAIIGVGTAISAASSNAYGSDYSDSGSSYSAISDDWAPSPWMADPDYGLEVAQNIAYAIQAYDATQRVNSLDFSTFWADSASVMDDSYGNFVPPMPPGGMDPALFNDAELMAEDASAAVASPGDISLGALYQSGQAMKEAYADYPDDSTVADTYQEWHTTQANVAAGVYGDN